MNTNVDYSPAKFKENVHEYIVRNIKKCVRFEPKDQDTLIGLPYPYLVPSISDAFQEMYYWDTYFACKGLLLENETDIAKNCAEDMAYLIERYGFMPNGNRTRYLGHSQPPYFCMLVDEVYKKTEDIDWLYKMYPFIEKEYHFWMTSRLSKIGLNYYSSADFDEAEGRIAYEDITKRVKYKKPISLYKSYADFAENALAECESGWDFNPRFDFLCKSFAPADLNSNLYEYEVLMGKFSIILQNGRESEWQKRAEVRADLMRRYSWNGSYFADYNFNENTHSPVFSAAAFHPLFVGLATEAEAESTRKLLYKIEMPHGIAACEKLSGHASYQWAYPNAWAPLHDITVLGLSKYGYKEDALRIAGKYVAAIDGIFESTHNLWEKYNAEDGTIKVVNEYEMPKMLGWTAGVYLMLENYIKENGKEA